MQKIQWEIVLHEQVWLLLLLDLWHSWFAFDDNGYGYALLNGQVGCQHSLAFRYKPDPSVNHTCMEGYERESNYRNCKLILRRRGCQ